MTEYAHGTVAFTVEFALHSDSGRDKHIDIDEQGAWLAQAFGAELLRLGRDSGDDVELLTLRYYGQDGVATVEPRQEYDISGNVTGSMPVRKGEAVT